ncbi:MAG: proline racemase family protein [Planctomycetota bacterium]
MKPFQVIDSHTGGEPTRLIVNGGPDLGDGPLSERRTRLASEFDHYRRCLCNEPRGSDVMVGGLIVDPHAPGCDAGVIFFNNVGPLGMCGHGTIGLVETLRHLGRVAPGTIRIDTPVGPVDATLDDDRRVSVRNVRGYRLANDVAVDVPTLGRVTGDIAWGGNWFFLVHTDRPLTLEHVPSLTTDATAVMRALVDAGITGDGGAKIDHVEFVGSGNLEADARNFVLCPGGAWDRSPCGTGCSAKVACLAADGKLEVGQTWRTMSPVGSVFEARYEATDGGVVPTITGRAFVTGETTVIADPEDPFAFGFAHAS